jgi:hypothetical protein
MSGLKINYRKSELFVLGCSEDESVRVSQMFNCNIGQLPLKYLGVMFHYRHMTASELNYVVAKVEKRVPTWQSVGLSSEGKMILVESFLSSVPNYTMGVYALQEEAH